MTERKKIKVLVAMSGGVDSSVAAALLRRNKKYEVVGASMKQWTDDSHKSKVISHKSVCTWKQDRRDALRVAAKLCIPLLTFDFEKEYRQMVAEYMFAEYKAGRTPNPDVVCNKYIKFGIWLDKARELGFDYLATGHYARLLLSDFRLQSTNKNRSPRSEVRLLQAKDKIKDQTYFLHQLTQEQLADVLFPIGGYLKSEVRSLARKLGLPTAEREESMGICFVGERPMKDFLKENEIDVKIGKIVTTSGDVIGEHNGLAFYTIGQRHAGFQISDFRFQNGDVKPLFVVDKRNEANELVVGYENDPEFYKKEITVVDVNWISGHESKFPLKCKVRLRHRQSLQEAVVGLQQSNFRFRSANNRSPKSELRIEFRAPQRAVTPGQFAVFYGKGECLGGGVIN